MQERLREILDNHSKSIEGTAKEIISELKAKTNTYGELEKELNRFEQGVRRKNIEAQKHQFLLSEIKRILGEEKNNLPIKYNNTRVITARSDIDHMKEIEDLVKLFDGLKKVKRDGVIE